MTRVMVTGGAGYIGSHICKMLHQAGHELVIFDDLSNGHADAVRWGRLEAGSLLDRERLTAVLVRHRPEVVIHMAGLIDVAQSLTAPAHFYSVNVAGSLILFEAMLEAGIGRLVFSSSCAVYGLPRQLPLTEDHSHDPISPYGASKQMVERILADLDHAHAFRSVRLRYFNAAGADPEGDLGERHNPETHAVPLAILTALGRRSAFHLYGTDYPTPDGTVIRDYVHVMDLAAAHLNAVEYLRDGASAAFNLGAGEGTSLRQLVDTVIRLSGRPLPVLPQPRRASDPPILVADPEKANRVLGWRPKLSSIDQIVGDALNWHLKCF
jgi:UDP-glucose 4-epimerase